MFLHTILKHSVKRFLVLNIIESDHLTIGQPIPQTSTSHDLIMIEASNLKHIE